MTLVTREGVSLKYDPELITSIVLVSQGWKKPGPGGRRSNTDPGGGALIKPNSSSYKGMRNPLGPDGNPIKCFKHFYCN